MGKLAKILRTGLALGLLYGASAALGLILMVLAFRLGILRSVDILFYRGLVVIGGVFALLLAGLAATLARTRWAGLSARDAVAAAVLSLSLNLSFLVVVPVTVDRSISIFVLGQMAAHEGETFTAAQMSDLFTRLYVGEHHQIARRLHEQEVSGNVTRIGDGYRINAHGRMVIDVARVVADLFESHAGLIEASPAKAAALKP